MKNELQPGEINKDKHVYITEDINTYIKKELHEERHGELTK